MYFLSFTWTTFAIVHHKPLTSKSCDFTEPDRHLGYSHCSSQEAGSTGTSHPPPSMMDLAFPFLTCGLSFWIPIMPEKAWRHHRNTCFSADLQSLESSNVPWASAPNCISSTVHILLECEAHTHLQVKEEPKICKMPSSACLFLQGKPPQNQRVGHPEVLRVSPIQQFFQAQNSLFFYFNMIIQRPSQFRITLFSFIPNMHCTTAQWPSFPVALSVFQGQLLCGATLPARVPKERSPTLAH